MRKRRRRGGPYVLFSGVAPDGVSYQLRCQNATHPAWLEWVDTDSGQPVAVRFLEGLCLGDVLTLLRREEMGRYLKRVAAENGEAKKRALAKDKETADSWPAWFEWMTTDVWEDGTARETSTLLVFVEDGLWKCCFSDREASRRLWVSGTTLGGMLGALDASLRTGEGDWREMRPSEPRGGKGKGK